MKKLSFLPFLTLLLAWPTASRAELIIEIVQSGTSVIVTASGTLDTAALTKASTGSYGGVLYPAYGFVTVGTNGSSQIYTGTGQNTITGSTSFESSGSENYYKNATSGSITPGTTFSSGSFGIDASYNTGSIELFTAAGYVSGSSISATDTYINTSIAGLGLTLGSSYTYSWGTGPDADSLVVMVIVPEPASMTMVISAAVIGLGVRRWSRRRTAQV